MTTKRTFFWDSCVFYRFLTGKPADLVPDIEQYIQEAQKKDIQILCSTMSFAEIRPSALKQKGYGSIDEFLKDCSGVFVALDPMPEVMKQSAILKDLSFKHATKQPRVIGTPDAIQLLTCLFVREHMGLPDTVFHTFDDGGGKTWEGKGVPILSLAEWTIGIEGHPLIAKLLAMPRTQPAHPTPKLALPTPPGAKK